MRGNESDNLLHVAKTELKKEKNEILLKNIFFAFALICSLLLLLVFTYSHLSPTGNVASVNSRGGYITNINLKATLPVYHWAGIYGFALRVPGLTEIFSTDIDSGAIGRADVFFDCIQDDAPGGPEIYASTSNSLDFSSVTPATFSMIDNFNGCSGEVFCANETFTETMSVMLGSTNITNIPSTYTFKFDGDNTIFNIGALNISGNLAFVTNIESIQKGFNPDVTVNYQMLLPTPVNSTQTYYFFADPNDECPSGGLGSSVNASLYGFIYDESTSLPLANASVNVAGKQTFSGSTGLYNLSFLVLPGTYNVIVQKEGYEVEVSNLTITFSNSTKNRDFELTPIVSGSTVTPLVHGFAKDESGNAINNASIILGNGNTYSNSTGGYSFSPTIQLGNQPIIAIKSGYDNYVSFLNITSNLTDIYHNITMELSNLNIGPGQNDEEGPGEVDRIIQEAVEAGQDFWIAPGEINIQIRRNTFIEQKIDLYNFQSGTMNVIIDMPSEFDDMLKSDRTSISIPSQSSDNFVVTILGTREIGTYETSIHLGGSLDTEIPVTIHVVDKKLPIETLFVELDLLRKVARPGGVLKYKINLQNLLSEQSYKVKLEKSVIEEESGEILLADESEEVEVDNSLSLLREISFPEESPEGEYLLRISAKFFNFFLTVEEPFVVSKPLYLYSFFGIPLWIILVIISALSFVLFNFFMYKRYVNKKKRYHLELNMNLLPKDGPRSIKIGKIAETNVPAYYDLDMLTTHAIIAGATGGGKSITAQVLIEEALMKGISVIVFDPTAQWSGMLRKCEDKGMISHYAKFGLKSSDAKAFPGNVRQITNSRQIIDVNKYMNPGQIQVFTLNKLDPSEMDIFVGSVIAQIFRSDPKEHPGLKTILVFDEVHRLLPKFGGSGRGFLQIERACREFRKWGLGVMLVSQVLSDFVGEIKANINTELQMRVAEENDLARIKERYGLDALKSLVRSEVGTGMFQNAEYNRGKPYFISFRPILHNTRRLSDEVLEKYNAYGEKIEDLEFSIEQLEAEKVDTFDLKMELKLVKDKLMTGNFTVVDIYLEGLEPRLAKEWDKIGKKPKKREIKLLSEEELQSSLEAAQKDRAKWNKDHKPEEGEKKEVKKDISAKIVKPITFDNGMMVSSLKELKDVLPTIDPSVMKIHVNEEKNDIAKWAEENIDKALGESLKPLKTKEEMVKTVEDFIKQKNGGDKKDEKKEEAPKTDDKNQEKEKSEEEKEEPKKESKTKSEPEAPEKKTEDKKEDPVKTKTEKEKPEKKEEVKTKDKEIPKKEEAKSEGKETKK